ncbi:MAG: type 4a pilus biogenesis protein PilO [Smithella sp.]|nr:type 4a pilus biogenesis protein PilO [Smithella sp.]MDM7986983.1 type 4a pilus biogenesis protein PilO [Smithella sp.]HOU52107.1 type 4a pilus biogenesis protein PilO [Smithella sp.]HQG65728.1 type 4a pilus biogenesis protein PilO [Smithella sp.]HQH16814.1 type 4a pilus biogenesis protein PilO [Smithella sp.]
MAIDINTIKKLPTNAKLGIIVLVFFLIGYFYWFFFLNSALQKKSELSTQLTEMQDKIKEKTKVAGQVKKFMADIAILKNNYQVALQKLPDQREIPSLFHSVSLAGRDAGVEFILFEPRASVPGTVTAKPPEGKVSSLMKPSDQRNEKAAAAAPAAPAGKNAPPPPEPFYEEIPVGVSVTGTYQNTLYFFDKVAKLPRIVNISDISMSKLADPKSKKNILSSTCTIKTYMFIDKKEKK